MAPTHSFPESRHAACGVLLAALAAAAGVAHAQPVEEPDLAQIYGDSSFVSIATGSRLPTSRAPSSATVITAEDIKAAGFVDLDEALETVPGLHVSRSSNYTARYTLRGIQHPFSGPHVLVLINGIPLTAVYQGDRGLHRGWQSTPVENIARIEVVRGPGSALYGADAFAGVINVITKTADELGGHRIGAMAGSLDTRGAWWQYGDRRGELEIAAHVQAGRTGGPEGIVAEDFQTALDRAAGTRLSYAPGPVSAGHDALDAHLDVAYRQWRWRADYNGRYRVGTGNGSFQALAPAERGYHNRILTDLTYQDDSFAPNWSLTAQLSFMHLYEQLYGHLLPPGAFGAFPVGPLSSPGIWERHHRVDVSALYTGWSGHRLRLGGGVAHDEIYKVRDRRNFRIGIGATGFALQDLGEIVDFSDTESFIYPHSRTVSYAFVQDEYLLAKDLYLTAGVRHDRYSDFGSTTNPRVALVWEAAYDITAKVMYGRAFRAPTFDDQYNTFLGAPRRLAPERVAMTEAALVWRPDLRSRLSLNVFHFRMHDVILPVVVLDPATGTFVFTQANRGRQSGRGAEVEAAFELTRSIRLSGNLAFQNAFDQLAGSATPDAPRKHLYVRGEWRFAPRWAVGSQLNWVADTRRAAGDPRPRIADYRTVDLTLRTQGQRSADQTGQWTLGAALRNVFNADAREPTPSGSSVPFDLPLPGRTLLLEASLAF